MSRPPGRRVLGVLRGVAVTCALTLLVTACSPTADDAAAPPAAAGPSTSGDALVGSALTVGPGLDQTPLDQPRQVLAPAGWTVSVWARVDGARLAAWTPDGALLVSRPKAGEVVAVAPGSGSPAGAPAVSTLLSGLDQPHGLAFSGDTLYVAESDQVSAYDYRDGAVSSRRTVVDGLPDAKSPDLRGAYAHALKSVAVGQDGAVYVSVGSTGNVSAEDRDADPQRATVLRVPTDGGAATVYARGVRNGTGLAVDPDGSVWSAVNNRDNIEYPFDRAYSPDSTGESGGSDQGKVLSEYVADHPLEPLAKLTGGRDLGWPYCNPDPDVEPGVQGSELGYADRSYVRDEETNADGSKLDCDMLPPVEQGMGAHSAPLGLSFADDLPGSYGGGALVGIHGSWNRQPPRPPEVAFFPWRDGSLGGQQTLLSGFQGADGTRWGRPVMAVQGPDDAVYVTDDYAGAVYRMAPR